MGVCMNAFIYPHNTTNMLRIAAVIVTCVLGLPAEFQGQPSTPPPARAEAARSVRPRLTVPLRLRLVDSLPNKYLAAEVRRQRDGHLVAFINSATLSAPVLADVIASLRGHIKGDSKYPQGLSVTFIARRYRPRPVAREDTAWLNDLMVKLRTTKRLTLSPGGIASPDSTTGDS